MTEDNVLDCPVCDSPAAAEHHSGVKHYFRTPDKLNVVIRCTNVKCTWHEEFTRSLYSMKVLTSNWNMRVLRWMEAEILTLAIAQQPIPHPLLVKTMNARQLNYPIKYGVFGGPYEPITLEERRARRYRPSATGNNASTVLD